jgi:DNA-binding beta-propeller fold protein YncE
LIASLGWRDGRWKSSALLVAAVAGLIAAIVAFIASLGRISDSSDSGRAAFESIAVLVIAVLPLGIATFLLLKERVGVQAPHAFRAIGLIVVTAVLLFAGAYTLRSTVMLSYYRADTSLELLAQRTSTPGVTALARQITNLSRDLTIHETSTQDPTGGHGVSIALESNVEWPYRWYFREFPNLETVEPGAGVATGADLVIAREPTDMDTSGYAPRLIPSRNRVPPEYLTPGFGSVLSSIILPSEWEDGVRFLLFREGITRPDAEPVAVGYGQRLSQKLFPSTGPYALNERVGTGSGRGQFNQPRGVAVNLGDGTIFVVDSANGRVQRFDASGEFLGAWGGPESSVTFEVTAEGLGPTGIEVGFDGLVYVADTWAHRIVVLNAEGQVVREFGTFGDTVDSPNAEDQPGVFFGPRDVAVTANEIYVVDTGNERVQVFTPDGTFVRSWGGYGTGETQFIEPVGIAIGPDDRVYIADSGNGRISVFARDGTPLAQWTVEAWQGQQYFEPYLAFDQFGRLYATSAGTASVEVFDLEGNHLQSFIDGGGEAFEAPVGIALASDGTMRVSDRNKSAVLQIPVMPPEVTDVMEASPVAGSPVGIEASPVGSPVASPESTAGS